jgi:gas vesicle protein
VNNTNNQLFLAGLFSGVLVGVLGALLMRRRGEEAQPFTTGGLVLPRRADVVAEEAERAAAEALARARMAIDGAGL